MSVVLYLTKHLQYRETRPLNARTQEQQKHTAASLLNIGSWGQNAPEKNVCTGQDYKLKLHGKEVTVLSN